MENQMPFQVDMLYDSNSIRLFSEFTIYYEIFKGIIKERRIIGIMS